MKIKHLQVVVLFLSFVLFACSGGESSVTPTQNIVSVGNLSVNISGLPDGLSADVTLTGTGVNQKITGSESITGLTTGTYTLTTATVLDANYNYSLDTPAFDISITENQTTEVSLDYLTNEVVSHGVITGFGSVYVNGTHYNTDATQLETDEGDDENINQLKLGMVVSVKGTLSANGVEGIAKSIRHTSKIKGIIDSIDLVTPSITVLSQTILIDEQTIFHDSELDALQATNLVSIDIVDTESGEFLATRIKLYDDDPDAVFKLSGNINELDEATTTFTIYDITVNYGSAEVNGDLVDGTLVSVKSLQQIVDSVFIAESIKVFSDDEHSDNYYTSYRNHAINGFVSDFVSVEEFSLGDFDITTNDETEYKGGIADDIVDGIQLNIHGRINSDGKIVAKKVRFGKSEVIKVSGEVTAVDVENQIIEILSIQFNIDNNTIFRDKSIEEDENFHLISVEVGDSLRINAFEQPDESMLAIKVTRVDDSDETCIEGIVESIESPQFVIDGVTITVSDATDIEGPDQTSIDLLAFFELLLTDVELEVKGLLNEEGILVATSIEFEDDDDDHDDHINKIAVTGVIADFESEAEFTVNGHAITTDENTEYKHGNILDLTTGILIKVKGNVDEEGLILASRILFQNTHDNSNRVELDGEIDTFDSVEDFTVNGNQVTVTDATRYVRGTIDNLILGAEVEIDARLSTDEIYIAYKIKFEDDDSYEDSDEVEFTGTIDSFTSETEFTVNGHSVTTNSATRYKHGEVTDLGIGVAVEIEGITLESGIILAQKVKLEDD